MSLRSSFRWPWLFSIHMPSHLRRSVCTGTLWVVWMFSWQWLCWMPTSSRSRWVVTLQWCRRSHWTWTSPVQNLLIRLRFRLWTGPSCCPAFSWVWGDSIPWIWACCRQLYPGYRRLCLRGSFPNLLSCLSSIYPWRGCIHLLSWRFSLRICTC